MSVINIWTDKDTSEAGPTVEEEDVSIEVEADPDDPDRVAIHFATLTGPLWTAFVSMERSTAERVARDINSYALFRGTP